MKKIIASKINKLNDKMKNINVK